jgi:hypothetical protein
MRIPPFIFLNRTAILVVFAVGCSKSIPNPTVSFQGYTQGHKVGVHVLTQATFEFKNPSQSEMVCQVKFQPRGDENIISISAGGSTTFSTDMWETNSVSSLRVTVMRLVPAHQFTVPVP